MIGIEQIRKIAQIFPEISEQPHFEKISFRGGSKIIATYNNQENLVCVKFSETEQDLFALYDKKIIYPVPNKWGKLGWTYIDLQKVKLAVFKQAFASAYKHVTKGNKMNKANTMDAYLEQFPESTKILLEKIRLTIQKAAPKAEEKISYGMPAFSYKGNLVYFAGYKNHIGLYALPSGTKAFAAELTKYKTSKGTIQFQLDKPIPYALITKIVKFRVKENEEKERVKGKKKP